ncbi:MAG TPA: DEAD/DEAH box helicase [Isosphaeraceae bacterium]|nr:DEAD/DEAH box helicase [Isosphaeraceae bacterium]
MPRASDDVLDSFHPAVSVWFRHRFGEPTPPQRLGWPEIASKSNTLIFAPTGSGKTLAAFLACLDHLWRSPRTEKGVRILYVSPLKALNEDIARNLQGPLAEILETARERGDSLEPLTLAVRTGDTSPSDRQKQIRRPPDILITTPESLHLLLTSKGREALRTVSHVVVDEIHALCPNKRGVFLSLLLERLEAITPRGLVRIGLSATQRPLEEVARYLGGQARKPAKPTTYEPRPVSIVDAGQRKALDLKVSYPGPVGPPGSASVWPAIETELHDFIRTHRSTIVFANNRRLVERLAAALNDRENEQGARSDPAAAPRSIARAHHGSLSLESRRQTEDALKRGELPAVVATASLELGIDMGAVDLVCQVESPGGIARGLQRVGRAGHVVGSSSKGRLIAKTPGDLLESAALAHAMKIGRVESLRVPTNCLDVLAQQVVACVAVERWKARDLFDLIRQSYPYRDLTTEAFEDVVKMVSGQYGIETFRDLKPRIGWDRVNNVLYPLPGSASLALIGGGVIPDTGQFPLYLGDDGPRLGELDEEFVLERRLGETFRLGTSTWRIERIDAQKVIVSRAEGASALHPFWRGEGAGRTAELGEAVGRFTRELCERLNDPNTPDWLESEYGLNPHAADRLMGLIRRQKASAGAVPDDRTILVETYRDEAGELGLAVLSPFGSKRHHALKLALQARLRRRLGVEVACLHGDDGLLIRLPGMDDPPLDLFSGLSGELAETLIREELGESALFGLRFRQNAGRALLMPRPDPAKRTPLWLQRLRARDLLQAVRRFPDFPIVVETFRECLMDDLDLPGLHTLLDAVQTGEIRVATHRGEVPSPFASELIFRFAQVFLYEWDTPRRGDQPRKAVVDEGILEPLLDRDSFNRLIDPSALSRVESRLRGLSRPPRSADEMAETLRRFGDLSDDELFGPMPDFLADLAATGRALRITLSGVSYPERWVLKDDLPRYESAFLLADHPDREPALAGIIRVFMSTRTLVDIEDLVSRYPIDRAEASALLEALVVEGDLVRLGSTNDFDTRWANPGNLDEVRRLSLALRRKETVAVAPEVYADFLARRQHVHSETRFEGEPALGQILSQLQGFAASLEVWESTLLPARLQGFRPAWLESALSQTGLSWRSFADGRSDPRIAFFDSSASLSWPSEDLGQPLTEVDISILAHLEGRGFLAVDEIALGTGLSPLNVRSSLQTLLRLGQITADRLDSLRSDPVETALASASTSPSTAGRPRLGRLRRPATLRPESRYRTVMPADTDPEASTFAWVESLLDRFGVLSRETVALDPWAPPWSDLAPWLHRAEMRGEIRRGYFVEGLSGVQYALSETADELARLAGSHQDSAPIWLLNTLDPANLYGAGAPLDIPLLEGGTARLSRSASNFLVMKSGRPVLIVENFGRRLTGLGSATESELQAAVALIPQLAGPSRRVLKIETYNTAPALASPAAPWLLAAGFVRDYPGVAYYAGW